MTTILDPHMAPASELAALYSERWEFESALDELKTHQHGPRVVLRSKLADGVYQEAWGMLCVHYAIRALLCQAAHYSDVDPDRVSFTRTMRAARRSVRRSAANPVSLAAAVFHATTEILQESLPQRRLRVNPRVVRRKMSNFGVKRPEHRLWPQPTVPISQAIRILSPPPGVRPPPTPATPTRLRIRPQFEAMFAIAGALQVDHSGHRVGEDGLLHPAWPPWGRVERTPGHHSSSFCPAGGEASEGRAATERRQAH